MVLHKKYYIFPDLYFTSTIDHCRIEFHLKSGSTESKASKIRLTSFRKPPFSLPPVTEFDSDASRSVKDTKQRNEKSNG